jgi:hypothetical protein
MAWWATLEAPARSVPQGRWRTPPAESRQQIGRPANLERRGDALQALVAGMVAVGVVEQLEVIDVEREEEIGS